VNRLTTLILATPFLLPSCKEEAAPASDPSAAAGPAAIAATQPSTREAGDADRLKNRVEAFRFEAYYSFAHGSGPGRVSGVILSVPPAAAPGPDRGPIDVRVLRITQAEAGASSNAWTRTDFFFAAGSGRMCWAASRPSRTTRS
jgi:hypothetical protein